MVIAVDTAATAVATVVEIAAATAASVHVVMSTDQQSNDPKSPSPNGGGLFLWATATDPAGQDGL